MVRVFRKFIEKFWIKKIIYPSQRSKTFADLRTSLGNFTVNIQSIENLSQDEKDTARRAIYQLESMMQELAVHGSRESNTVRAWFDSQERSYERT